MIYELFIFDRHCACVFHTAFNKLAQGGKSDGADGPGAQGGGAAGSAPGGGDAQGAGAGGGVATGAGGLVGAVDKQTAEKAKLVFGVVFSLRNIVSKISPKQGDNFVSFRTSTYKLHYFESGTGIKFVLLTDPQMENMPEVLRSIYAQVYVEYVSKNPLLPADGPINNELFRTHLLRFVRMLPGFSD
ncbi:Trafficking protein particle complex subunit BET5 [Polyrhizophydium stewartii]|uniref:Trafficking protein particle complex subunit n=1 Tax=Polyrhizophydium stewartii TaxID=2732419 RepID=A0ABR4NKK6_9FUNG|nr:Trafficking protein particle complex subunit 1 [Polyrhizophydium stewartii]